MYSCQTNRKHVTKKYCTSHACRRRYHCASDITSQHDRKVYVCMYVRIIIMIYDETAMGKTNANFWHQFLPLDCIRDVKVSRPTLSRDHFFGLGLGLTVIGLDLGLGLMRYWSRVSYVLVSWSQSDHLLSWLINNSQHWI